MSVGQRRLIVCEGVHHLASNREGPARKCSELTAKEYADFQSWPRLSQDRFGSFGYLAVILFTATLANGSFDY